MKLAPNRRKDIASATLIQTLGLVVGLSSLIVLSSKAANPSWWSTPGTTAPSAVVPPQVLTNTTTGDVTTNYITNDFAAVTQGQLKHFTARAVDYLNANLTNGAGTNLNTMVSNWASEYAASNYSATNIKPSDYTAVNVGQLKYVGKKVWSQLVAGGYTNAVPTWLAPNTNTDNSLAVIGQLKTLFNFDLATLGPVPNPITGLTATVSSNPDEIDLSWTLPTTNTGTSVIIQQSTDGGTTWTTIATLDPTSTSYAATGLTNGTTYSYQVALKNGGGTSAYTGSGTPTLPVPQLLPPTGLLGALDGSGVMNLSWQTSTGATGYEIERETLTTGIWATLGTSTTATYSDTSYGSGGFHYRVSATSSTGTSAPSTEYPLSQYAVIDLGPSQASGPIIINNLGTVLSEQVSGGSNTLTRWKGGVPQTLIPPSSVQSPIANTKSLDDLDNVIVDCKDTVPGYGFNNDVVIWTGTQTLGTVLSTQTFTYSAYGTQESSHMGYGLSIDNGVAYGIALTQVATNPNGNYSWVDDGVKWTSPNSAPSELGSSSVAQSGYSWNFSGTAVEVVQSRGGHQITYTTGAGNATAISGGYFSNVTTFLDGVPLYGISNPSAFYPWDVNSAGEAIGNLNGTDGLYQGGTATPFTQLLGIAFYPQALNARTLTINGNSISAPQIIGNAGSENSMSVAERNSVTGQWQQTLLDDQMPAASGWTAFDTGRFSINNCGAIVGTATYSGTNTAIAAGSHGVMLLPFEFISVPDNTNQAPQVLSNLPAIDKSFFESLIDDNGTSEVSGPAPVDGDDASTDPTKAQVTLSGPLSTTVVNILSLTLTRLSDSTTVSDTLTETAVNSRVFKNGSGNLEVDLLAPIDLSTFILSTQISNSTWGTSVVQDLVATSSSSYVYKTKSITTSITFTGALSGTTADTISIHLVNPSNSTQSRDVSLTETGANTQVFQGGGVTVTFTQYNGFTAAQDSVILTVNDPTYSISNEPTVVWEEGLNSLVFDSTGAAVSLGDGNPLGDVTTGQPYSPPAIPANYKFKIKMAKGLANGATTTLTLNGLDSSGNQLETTSVEMDEDPNNTSQYISKKTIVAVDGGVVSDAIKNAYPDYIFIDPPHLQVVNPGANGGTPIILSDKTTTYVFPAVRWQLSGGSYSDLTDAYKPGSGSNLGTIHPEPSTGAVAFEHDTNVELFAIVREYDTKQQKSRYFCGAADKPATITVTESHTGSPKTVPLEDPSQAPDSINGTVKWYSVGLSQAVADNTADVVQPIPYQDNEISTDDGQWSVQVGGASHRGVAWYKIAVGNAESLGATARQYTEDDCPISDLVMRIVVKGNYPQDSTGYLGWVSTMINVPFCDGARPNQVLNFRAVDCAKTALCAWYRMGHTPYQSGYFADKLVELAKAGKYVMVMPPTPIYPDGDTTPGHTHWTDMTRPQPGDLVIFDWPTMHGAQFDHTTIFVGPAGGGHFAAGGADETIYASSNPSFNFEVQDKDYSVLYNIVQEMPSDTRNPSGLPVRIAIVRLQ